MLTLPPCFEELICDLIYTSTRVSMTASLFKHNGQSASTKAKFFCHLKDKSIFYIIYQNPFP